MLISFEFFEQLRDSKIMKMHKVPRGHHTFEYGIQHYKEGQVLNTLELENLITSDVNGNIVGYFGINFEHNIFAYYLKI